MWKGFISCFEFITTVFGFGELLMLSDQPMFHVWNNSWIIRRGVPLSVDILLDTHNQHGGLHMLWTTTTNIVNTWCGWHCLHRELHVHYCCPQHKHMLWHYSQHVFQHSQHVVHIVNVWCEWHCPCCELHIHHCRSQHEHVPCTTCSSSFTMCRPQHVIHKTSLVTHNIDIYTCCGQRQHMLWTTTITTCNSIHKSTRHRWWPTTCTHNIGSTVHMLCTTTMCTVVYMWCRQHLYVVNNMLSATLL